MYRKTKLNKNRLETLTDGVFAIIMTLLVIEVRVPRLIGDFTNQDLWTALDSIWPLISSFFISFAVLATYWMAHQFIFDKYVKRIDRVLAYLNMLFLSFASLVPFSANFLGLYFEYNVATIVYSINIIFIGLSLFVMRAYILSHKDLQTDNIPQHDVIHGTIRIFLPPVFSFVSIWISFYSINLSLLLFAFPIIFNMIPGGLNWIEHSLFEKRP